mmetsp:Transcript_8397/g.18111  ORF Transcript_8397/g.18111 Transcript_8397/m.18111 type:complete len:330 (-) Transcript_8397:246-1235(-)
MDPGPKVWHPQRSGSDPIDRRQAQGWWIVCLQPRGGNPGMRGHAQGIGSKARSVETHRGGIRCPGAQGVRGGTGPKVPKGGCLVGSGTIFVSGQSSESVSGISLVQNQDGSAAHRGRPRRMERNLRLFDPGTLQKQGRSVFGDRLSPQGIENTHSHGYRAGSNGGSPRDSLRRSLAVVVSRERHRHPGGRKQRGDTNAWLASRGALWSLLHPECYRYQARRRCFPGTPGGYQSRFLGNISVGLGPGRQGEFRRPHGRTVVRTDLANTHSQSNTRSGSRLCRRRCQVGHRENHPGPFQKRFEVQRCGLPESIHFLGSHGRAQGLAETAGR